MKLKKIFEDLANMAQPQQKVDDHEATMAIADLKQLAEQANQLAHDIQAGQELEGWVQAKITKAADYIQAVHKYYHYRPEQDCHSCGDMKESMEPKLAYGDQVYSNIEALKSAAKKISNKPENYTVLSNQGGSKVMLTTNKRATQFAKEGNWMIVGKIDPNGNYREIEQSRLSGTQSWNSAPNKWALQEEKSTCCGRCGHKHVKGTSCPKPFLTGKRHCRNRPK
jgi:hypothetical protein